MTPNISILWADDEIDLLKAHILFLESKGYRTDTVTNGRDAVDMIRKNNYDIVFLDENMPGMSGLETLQQIKDIDTSIPVVMITKSEEENIMDMAIGAKIADYIIKPVNPNQVLLSIKKHVDARRLISESTTTAYQSRFRDLSMQIAMNSTFDDWAETYRKLVYWELELQNISNMDEVLMMQKREANIGFAKYIRQNYLGWIADPDCGPLTSPRLMSRRILPMIEAGQKVVMIVIDNFRLDQWETIRAVLAPDFNINTEIYCSILPTATQYARNAIFSGLMPQQIIEMMPECWVDTEDEGSQNQFENQLIGRFFERYRCRNVRYGYYKVNDATSGLRLNEIYSRYADNHFNAFVYNFVDMLSHARTEVKMIKELAQDETAYRAITLSWFKLSPLYKLLQMLRGQDVRIVITTDHGTIRVSNPVRIIGDREVNTNLRFKTGRNLTCKDKDVFVIRDTQAAQLPRNNLSSSYMFATNNDFFAYPNNYNHYVGYYRDTFQHGGISMEEMLIPFATLTSK